MRTGLASVVALLLAVGASAQEPVGPPPDAGAGAGSGPDTYELLPDIGRIGAQVAVFAGGSWNPWGIGRGLDVGGVIDLPLARTGSGKLSYSISLGLSLAESEPFTVTSSVALVANLAAGASFEDALAGPPRAPFPVVREVRTGLRLLHLSPFSLKYTFTGLDRARLRPWIGGGVDFVVAITQERPERDESLLFPGTAPFDAELLGGLIAQAPELRERGSPTGQGNIEVGGHAAAGLEIRMTSGLSLNLEYRYTLSEGTDSRLHTAAAGVGFHW